MTCLIGFILVWLNIILISAGACNRHRRLDEKYIPMLAVIAIADVLLGTIAGICLMAGKY